MSRYSAFTCATLLVVVFVAAKFAVIWSVAPEPNVESALGASAEDIMVAMGFGLIAAGGLRATRSRLTLQRWMWRAICLLTMVFAVYAVGHIGFFKSLQHPLTVHMFGMVGRLSHMRSSIAAQATGPLLAGLAATLLAAGLVWMGWLRVPRAGWLRFMLVAITGGVAIWGSVLRARSFPERWANRAGANPHWAIIRSMAVRLFQDRRIDINTPFPQSYLADFRPAAQCRMPPLDFARTPPKNVIVLVLESVGSQYMSLYGSRYDTTPNLVAEAGHAMIFDRFYANAGFTSRSAVAIFSSTYPGLPWRWHPSRGREVPKGPPHLLKDRGYRTAFVSVAHADWDGMQWYAEHSGLGEFLGPDQLGGPAASSWGTEDGVAFDGLIKWIDRDRERPFYAVLWTDQTHHPYTLAPDARPVQFFDPSSRQNGEDLNRYLNAVRQVDGHVGRLFEALRARGLAEDTLVVITGDHGEGFGEPHEYLKHGSSLFDDSQRVPLMLWNPRLFPQGKRIEKAGAHVDIDPTIAHLMGLQIPEDWQGASLFSPDHSGRAYFFADFVGYQFGVTDGRHKFILYATDGYERLFDLRQDPLEHRDLSASRTDVAAEMRARISAFVRAEEAYFGSGAAQR